MYIFESFPSSSTLYPTVDGGIPVIFENCSSYQYPNDNKYAECDLLADNDPCEYLKALHKAKNFRPYFLGLIPFVFSVIALIINLAYATISILFLMKQKPEERYTFLLSRSISTIIAQIMFYIVLIAWHNETFEYFPAVIFLILGTLSFLTLAGTYVAFSTTIYIAITHSKWYKKNISVQRCALMNICIWAITVTFSIVVGIYGATLFYPETAPVTCTFNTCQQPLLIVIVILSVLCYVTVLAVYLFSLLRMKAKTKNLEATTGKGSIRRNINVMNRMSYNLLIFALSKMPLLIVCIIALFNSRELRKLGDGKKTFCKTFKNGKTYFEAELLAAIAGFIWLSGMILDPVINIIIDYKKIKNRLKQIHQKLTNKSK